jgi:hypothetical protein
MERPVIQSQRGSVYVSEDTVLAIAKKACRESEGIVFERVANRHIKMDWDGDALTLRLTVQVKYGTAIPKICDALRRNVSFLIQDLTGIRVSRIDIEVTNLVMP